MTPGLCIMEQSMHGHADAKPDLKMLQMTDITEAKTADSRS